MAIHVTCPQCKKQVPFGRLFCTFCGAKLELTPDRVSNRVSTGEALDVVRRWVIRIFSLFVVSCFVGVFLWPMAPMGEVGSNAHAASCDQRMQSSRARTLNGVVFMERFPEAEVNAWLRREIAKMASREAGMGFRLQDVTMDFKKGFVVMNARLGMSKAVLTYEVELAPALTSQGFRSEVRSLRIGHMPIPAFAAPALAGRVLHVFNGMREEADLLGKMKQMEVDDGVVRVSNQGR